MSFTRLIDCINGVYSDNIIQTISEMSKNQEEILIESNIRGINFDLLTKYYFDHKNSYANSPSNDSVLNYKGKDYFVEFKDSKGKNIKKRDLYEKIRSSMLVYLDITNERISSVKENVGYILVYNPYKDNPDDSSIKRINNILGQYAYPYETKDKYNIKSNYEGLYFKEVLFFTPLGFKMSLDENAISI